MRGRGIQASMPSNLSVDVAAVQGTHLTCAEDCQVLEGDFVIFQHLVAAAALGSLC